MMKTYFTTALLSLAVLLKTASAQTGTNDAGYITGTGFDNGVLAVAVQPSDDKTIVSGWFSNYNGTAVNRLARLNTDGTIDGTFNSGTGVSGSGARIIKFQQDEKIIIAGTFSGYNGTAVSNICRLNTDGTLDGTFQVTGCDDQVTAVAIQGDGKLILGGWFTSINGTAVNRIVRLNSNGTIDNTFNVGTGADLYVAAIAIQTDGKIIIGGNFTNYNGTSRNRVARLNTDGSLDATFTVGNGADAQVVAAIIQPDGKILIAGTLYSYNSYSNYRVVRINTDGSPDTGFSQTGTGINNEVYTMALQQDGKIVLGGTFQNYNGQTVGRVVRLLPNGNLDDYFDVTGANGTVNSIALQYNQKIIVGGEFTSYDGEAKGQFTRLNNCIFSPFSVSGSFTVCHNTGTTLSVVSDGGIQSWYSAETGGTYLAPGSGFTTPLLTESVTYYVQDSLDCGAYRTPVEVVVHPAVLNTITQDGASLISDNVTGGATYQWFNCTTQQPVTGETDSIFTPIVNGSYALILTIQGCSDTSGCIVVDDVGISTHEYVSGGIFPDPASTTVMLSYTFASDVTISIGVYDVSGRLITTVISDKSVFGGQSNTEIISVGEYPSGFYFISINASNGEQIMHKLMVAR